MTVVWLSYLFLVFMGCLVGTYYYRQLNTSWKILTFMLLCIGVIEISALLIVYFSKTNYPLYHIVPLVLTAFYGVIFYHRFKFNSIQKHLPIVIGGLVIFASLYVSKYVQSIYTFPSIGLSLLGLFVTCFTLVLFMQMLLSPENTVLIRQPQFWFAVGSLIFYSSTFFVFGLFKTIQDTGSGVPEWGYHLIRVANYIMYTCYLITLWLAGRQGKKKANVMKK